MATPQNNSVRKAFDILRLFVGGTPALTAGEVAQRTGLTPATAHRFLLTLEQLGALARRDGHRYQLGLLLADLGDRVEHDSVLTGAVQPHIDDLVESLRESVTLAVLDGDRVVVAGSGEAPRSLRIGFPVGRLLPLHASAVGKVLLAHEPPPRIETLIGAAPLERLTTKTVTEPTALRETLAGIRAAGWAVDDEEMDEGLRCVAVPIRGAGGRVLGALSVSAPTARMNDDRLDEIREVLLDRAARIGERVGVQSKVLPDKAAPRGSFPHLKRVGDFVLISGTSARRPDDSFEGVHVDATGRARFDIRAQTEATLRNIADMLASVGAGLDDVVDMEAFLIDMADYDGFNEVHARHFGPTGPTRTTVAVSALPHPHQRLMIKAMAYAPVRTARPATPTRDGGEPRPAGRASS
ncbi:MAG: IclR family transcriptional regulator C-terminal domain-containing protein [Azospirillaceae bacterium]